MPEPIALGRLAQLVGGELIGEGGVSIADVVHDSRQAAPGTLFVAVPGLTADGHHFVPFAMEAGTSAVCVEHRIEGAVPQLVVASSRAVLGRLAAEVHGNPSEAMAVIGVTGTDGKTTVTHLYASIARAAGLRVGVIGTLGAFIDGEPAPLSRTTPEASDLQRLLRRMHEAGVETVAMEVSSHALAMQRVASTRFETVAFTNLSQDHLDFHPSLEEYYLTKASLFTSEYARRAVICVEDAWGHRLAGSTRLPVTTVGLAPDCMLRAEKVWAGTDSAEFVLAGRHGQREVTLPIGGDFNVLNALVAAGCGVSVDLPLDRVVAGLEAAARVPGRFETIAAGQPFAVIVDYAHTPEGIRSVTSAARRVSSGRILTVVGAGGDRDRSKRAAMGREAAAADLVFITSDNPRSEDPAEIAAQVEAGTRTRPTTVTVELDRRAAIALALSAARPGDVVLILGKGHESGQEAAGVVLPFDDRVVAREELVKL